MSLLWFGIAISQSTVTNNQVQVGDVTSSQTLNVVTATSDTTATNTSTANNLTGSVVSGSLDVESTQIVSGAVQASTTLNATTDSGPTTSLTTAATGNTGDSNISGGGALTGNYSQTTSSSTVDAELQVNAPTAQTTDAAISVQAIANSQSLGTTGSTIYTSVGQGNGATTEANGGVVYQYVGDQASFSSIAAGNNVTSESGGGSTQTIDANQVNDGAVTQATMFANLGNSEVTTTNATATGNNVNVTNSNGPLAVGNSQDNESYVRAQAVETSYEYGGATVSAYGVGNSVMAGNEGPGTVLNNVQVNGTGGVDSIASFSGNNGYDSMTSATAVGNSATGFACSACGGAVSVNNSQTNQGGVAATSSTSLTSGARSVRSTATAVGNTGSFYVSSPSD